LDTALRLTAIALLLRPMGGWFVRPAILAAAVLILVYPRALRHPIVWGGVALLTAIRIAGDWPLSDNHIYLLCYWTLAIALSLRAHDASSSALAYTSRWLIGLAFAFAVLWKVVLSPDFLDQRFFRVTLLTDPRFGVVARLIGGLSADELEANRQALTPLAHGAELLDPPRVHEPAPLRAFAAVSTWGSLFLEAAVSVLMLAPTTRFALLRHGSLLSFCGVTYAFAPVAGFGWLLLTMGLAQLDERQRWWRGAYVVAFVAVLFYDELPWAELALNLLR
jgi:hypothetical protein